MLDTLVRRIQAMPSVTEMLRKGATPKHCLNMYLRIFPTKYWKPGPLKFLCSCSKPRMEQALISLGHQDLVALIHEREEVEVTCEFCRERYLFRREELERLLQEIQ